MTEPHPKKARFDARNPSTLATEDVENDAILELDEIGTGGPAAKKSAVKLDGYDSDSSTENFDARAEARVIQDSGGKKTETEEEADMFADLNEEPTGEAEDSERDCTAGRKRKKVARLIEESEIQGQIASSRSGGHVSADFSLDAAQQSSGAHESSSESGDDEDRDRIDDGMDEELGAGSKKRHAPRLDAFNMRNEAEEGKFDESGNFVRNATDPMAVHDAWLEGSSRASMKKAKEAHDRREAERRQKDIDQDAFSSADALSTLITHLRNGETPLEALARLGQKRSKKQHWRRNKKTQSQKEVEESAEDHPQDEGETNRRKFVEEITAAADILFSRDQVEVYDTDRALLMRQYTRETGKPWEPSQGSQSMGDSDLESKSWFYRWADSRDGGKIHGPFDAAMMTAWSSAGYFGHEVEFNRAGHDDWQHNVQAFDS